MKINKKNRGNIEILYFPYVFVIFCFSCTCCRCWLARGPSLASLIVEDTYAIKGSGAYTLEPRLRAHTHILHTPWSLNRLFKGILNDIGNYFGGVFSLGVTRMFVQNSLPKAAPNSPEHPQHDPLKFPENVAK